MGVRSPEERANELRADANGARVAWHLQPEEEGELDCGVVWHPACVGGDE